MSNKLIRIDYPNIDKKSLKILDKFVKTKCSEYYFIDYLRCTDGDVVDAIKFYKFDDNLRTNLTKYIIRFEIQIKTDFVRKLYKSTKSDCFWKDKKYYFNSALNIHKGKLSSQYDITVSKIQTEYQRYKFKTPGPSNYVALSFCSFGSFQSLYKYIDLKYKSDFIKMYTRDLPTHDFKNLNLYLSAIRITRNRCAHGNHISTLKIKNQFQKQINIVKSDKLPNNTNLINPSVFDMVLLFLYNRLTCEAEFKESMRKIFAEYKDLLIKYKGKHPFTENVFKMFLH